MAPYCTQSDLELAVGGAEALIQLCDQDDTGLLDSDKMDRAIELAQSIVDAYVSKVMAVPVASPTKALTLHAALVAAYWLKTWAHSATAEDARLYVDVVLAWLAGVGSGKIGIDADPQPPTNTDRPDGAYPRNASLDVSRKKLGGVLW